jgi:uncharacterized membrane-anchored protein YitT (DUF2179 family)
MREIFIDILYDILGSFVLSIGIYSFVEPINIAPGGVSGIALMVNYLTNLPVGLVSFLLNVPIIVAGYRLLGGKCVRKTIITAIISAVMLDEIVEKILPQYEGDIMLASLFGGALMGLGMSIIFRRGSTTGGTDIISHILKAKKPVLSLGRAILAVDSAVIISSVIVYGKIEAAMYSLICLYATVETIDKAVPEVKNVRENVIMETKR